MKKGHLFFDYSVRRFDIAFDKREFHDNEYHTYGGLHCGQTLQILTAEQLSQRIKSLPPSDTCKLR